MKSSLQEFIHWSILSISLQSTALLGEARRHGASSVEDDGVSNLGHKDDRRIILLPTAGSRRHLLAVHQQIGREVRFRISFCFFSSVLFLSDRFSSCLLWFLYQLSFRCLKFVLLWCSCLLMGEFIRNIEFQERWL